ncbi:MAG: type II toxin-antitoxin system VapC family toxin [Rubrivivax sp.]|nr:type II toxin-antitoxin system VapC family toxin [Rubrivivax sp.]
MTRYMLDTNTVSHLLKKHPAVARRVVAVPITSLCISAITQGELLFGLARRPEATTLHDAVWEFLRRVDVLPWDTTTAEVYGPARAAAQREGRVLAPMDLLIGSHALSIDAVLVTNDRAFAQLPGLSIEDWTEDSR